MPLAQAAKNNLHLADQPHDFTIVIHWTKDTFLKRTTIKIESDVHKIKIEIVLFSIFMYSFFIFIGTKMNESADRGGKSFCLVHYQLLFATTAKTRKPHFQFLSNNQYKLNVTTFFF